MLLGATTRQTRAAFFNGTTLAVDHTGYLSQHGVVYNTPSRHIHTAMPIGDGRLAACIWCPPEGLALRVAFTDPAIASNSGEPPATETIGCTLLVRSDPSPLADTTRFRQRLAIHTAVVEVESANAGGSLQAEAWVAAEHNVLILRYSDAMVRSQLRTLQMITEAGGKAFSIGEHIGVVDTPGGHRLALVCALLGHGEAGWAGPRSPQFAITSARGTAFTLLVAGAVAPSHGDPVALARTKIAAVLEEGIEEVNRRHRQRWRHFWDRSVLHLASSDTLASYLEHLWFLYQYHAQACGPHLAASASRNTLWRRAANEDSAQSHSVYVEQAQTCLPLFASAHDELVAPWLDRVAAWLCRRSLEPAAHETHGDSASEEDALAEVTALLLPLWHRWLFHQDRNWLRFRVYPPLRACANRWARHLAALQAPGSAALAPLTSAHIRDSGLAMETVARLRWLFRTAEEAASQLEEDRSEAEHWGQLASVLEQLPATPLDVYPYRWRNSDPAPIIAQFEQARFSPNHADKRLPCPGPPVAARLVLPDTLVWTLEEYVHHHQLFPQGLFGDNPDGAETAIPRLAPGAELVTAIQEMCLHFRDGVLDVAACLPPEWDAAFSLAAPSSLRVMAQTFGGEPMWIAITPDNSGTVRLRNPWQAEARVLVGRREILRTADQILAFQAQKHQTYIVDRREMPLSRMLRVRLTARPRLGAHLHGYRQVGLD